MSTCAECEGEIVGWSVTDQEVDVELHVGCLYDYSQSLLTNRGEAE